ncbi:MAG: hypothetical protein HQL01_14815 [Nitrospirae bacterium]|nr:hypothetical protein [Nitrospirota bacterium]
MKTLRLALAQINPTVGGIKNNSEKIIAFIEDAQRHSADIVAFPELCITGYPPEDLLLKPSFIKDNIDALNEIKRHTGDIVDIVGFVQKNALSTNALMYSETSCQLSGSSVPTFSLRAVKAAMWCFSASASFVNSS